MVMTTAHRQSTNEQKRQTKLGTLTMSYSSSFSLLCKYIFNMFESLSSGFVIENEFEPHKKQRLENCDHDHKKMFTKETKHRIDLAELIFSSREIY